jgi:hypothetical protein
MSCAFKFVNLVHGSKVNQLHYLAHLHDFVDLGSQLVDYGVQGVAGSNPAVPIELRGLNNSLIVEAFVDPLPGPVAQVVRAHADRCGGSQPCGGRDSSRWSRAG